MNKNLKIALVSSGIFFFALLGTLSHYGISWDSATHFKRGQAYLHYFLTGEKEYSNVSQRRSFYQNDIQNGKFWLKDIHGHPPTNDVLAALSNFVLFQKLAIVGDVESYNVFIVFASSLVVFITVLFMLENSSIIPALAAGLVVSTYPLFWSEAHFNIKDPILTSFLAIGVYCFTKIINTGKRKWIYVFFIFWGLALGVKFNAVFLPFIIAPYAFLNRKKIETILKKNILTFALGWLITIVLFIIFWPALWQGNILTNILEVFNFYKEIGTQYSYQPAGYYFLGFNTYPSQWIIFTTPIATLLLFVLGIYVGSKNWKKNNYFSVLLFAWFAVPVLRVSMPNTTIYGGVRQIMEYIPPMAMIAGMGMDFLIQKLKKVFRNAIGLVLICGLAIACLIPLINYHPNENVYFNFLIGGLSGAKARNFPSWGNSFGNSYKQGIDWLNENAPLNAKLTLIQGELINLPKEWVRQDIAYAKTNYSGENAKGEYLMELIFDNTVKQPFEVWNYVENNLNPVYEVKVDGVTILAIWKNDLNYRKQ